MFLEDTLWSLFQSWRKYKAEDELYLRLRDNPVWPFRTIGEEYFHLVYHSDRVAYGTSILVVSTILFAITVTVVGRFSVLVGVFIVTLAAGLWAIHGKCAWRELIISNRGRGKYMVRILRNEEILFQHEIRNIYIRLRKEIDALGDPHFSLMLGGYELDDMRLTRMTKNENALRLMGMKLAYNLGINFFDWQDVSVDHLIWHYRGFSKLTSKNESKGGDEEVDVTFRSPKQTPLHSFMSIPTIQVDPDSRSSHHGHDHDHDHGHHHHKRKDRGSTFSVYSGHSGGVTPRPLTSPPVEHRLTPPEAPAPPK